MADTKKDLYIAIKEALDSENGQSLAKAVILEAYKSILKNTDDEKILINDNLSYSLIDKLSSQQLLDLYDKVLSMMEKAISSRKELIDNQQVEIQEKALKEQHEKLSSLLSKVKDRFSSSKSSEEEILPNKPRPLK